LEKFRIILGNIVRILYNDVCVKRYFELLLKVGENINKVISIGNQGFESIRDNDNFFIDKTHLIKEWWENQDVITLITRPRRFGKTLNMSMLECFFSNKYADRRDLFEGLSIWNDEKYRKLQGTYPVIFLSFASVKADNLEDSKVQIKQQIARIYEENRYLLSGDILSVNEKKLYNDITMHMEDAEAVDAIHNMSMYLERYYHKKVIILLDEYDTPMQEAYINGYWDKFTAFIRSMFNVTFKTNSYLERAVMTGITRVSKESVFSDLNNLRVITTTSDLYSDCFGFTEEEVFDSLDIYGMSDKKDIVKKWYDGFIFGGQRDIYNPWSITNYLKEKKLRPYWASTSSNGLISKLIQTASADIKTKMEDLLKGDEITVNFDEQIVFNQLDYNENAIWSLLLASGYLKAEDVDYRGITLEPWYKLSITNLETMSMFSNMFAGWFQSGNANYNSFVKALLRDSIREMNVYMNDVALATFSSFDTGSQPSRRSQPERFYHGFVLGLLVELREKYLVKSNRESGYGRYDVILVPLKKSENAIILEFKVYDPERETSLHETVQSALQQIEEKDYDTELISMGIPKEQIRHYGFAFEGKKVLIG